MIYTREFPLPEQQQGAMLGNGLLGAQLWGEDNLLNMSIGCAALWDHRGGLEWTPEQNLFCDSLFFQTDNGRVPITKNLNIQNKGIALLLEFFFQFRSF